jgi:hypothetical protein
MVHGSWFIVHSSWFIVYGLWHAKAGTGNHERFRIRSSLIYIALVRIPPIVLVLVLVIDF